MTAAFAPPVLVGARRRFGGFGEVEQSSSTRVSSATVAGRSGRRPAHSPRARRLRNPTRKMKLKVKSHVQQERNMRGHKDKFPTPPPDLNARDGPYKPRVPTKEGDGVNPFARQLASGDKDVRDATFAALGKWLGARADVPLLDMKKIWKGLFYAMWHADGWDVQEELAEQIAGLTHALRHKVALTYLGVFYITARREWVGIDRHRMDKYLRLVRRVTSHALRYCANRDWRADVVQDIAAVFEKAALVAGTKGMVDVGLRLHISELFVGELRKVAAGKDKVEVGCDPDDANEPNGGAPRTVFRASSSAGHNSNKRKSSDSGRTHRPTLVPSEATESFLCAFATVLQFDAHKPLHGRVLGAVFEAAAEGADGGVAQQALLREDFEFDEDETDGIDPKARKEALAAATMVRLDAATMKRMSRRFIELGAAEGVEDLNRESLYHVHTLFRKAAKRAAKAAQAEEADAMRVDDDQGRPAAGAVKKKRKKTEPREAPMEDEDSEEDLEESFHTAASESESEEEEEKEEELEEDEEEAEETLTPSKRKNLKGTFDDARDSEEEDAFEEADEFADVEMEEEEDDEEGSDEVDALDDDSLESLDDSDLDNSEDERGSSSDSDGDRDGEDVDSDEEMARHEATVAAGIAAAERKALRKAERWAAAVGATPPPASDRRAAVPGQRVSARKGTRAPTDAALLSPSKRVLWNLKRNTRHTPTGPPNPVKGDGLRALLNTTPRKSLLRPIHAAAEADRNAPGSDPGARREGNGHGEHSRKKETMTPGRKKVKASTFF